MEKTFQIIFHGLLEATRDKAQCCLAISHLPITEFYCQLFCELQLGHRGNVGTESVL